MAQTMTAELERVLWLFGRACTAQLPRDVLLDAAVGLEMLLVPGPGEARYRFGLHGMALLGHEPADVIEGELRKIYKLRSEAAHGATQAHDLFREMASRSRFLLAKMIQSIVALTISGELDLKASKGDIGNAVESYVRRKVAAATRVDPFPPGR